MNRMAGYNEKLIMRIITGITIFMLSNVNTQVYAEEKPEIFVQLGHCYTVTSVVFSPDGKYALSGSGDFTAKLWDVSTGREIRTFKGHESAVSSIAFSPDGKHMISGSWDNTLKLWELFTGREMRTFKGHTKYVTSVAFSPDGKYVISGSWDNTLKLWDVSSGAELRTFKGHAHYVSSVAISQDGRYALSGSYDNTLKLWDVSTSSEKVTFIGHANSVNSVAFSADGEYALSGSADKTLKLWDVSTGRELRTLKGHVGAVSGVGFDPEGRLAVSGSHDGSIRIWDLAAANAVRVWVGHARAVMSVSAISNGRYVLSGGWDGSLKLWDAAAGEEIRAFEGYVDAVKSVAFSPDGKHALSGYGDVISRPLAGAVKLWDISAGREINTLSGHKNGVSSVAFSPDGKSVLSGSSDQTLRLWNIYADKATVTIEGHRKYITAVAFSPNGKYALSGSGDNTLKLWEMPAGREAGILRGHTKAVKSVTLSPDGRHVLSGSEDGALRLWEIATGKEIRIFRGHTDTVSSVAFSPDGRYALSGSTDKTLKLWEVASGKEIRTFSGHTMWVYSVAFSPDGKYALSGSHDETARLWEVATGKEVKVFRGHTNYVGTVAFIPDAKYALTGGADGTLRFWDISTGKDIARFVSFKDGEWIVITTEGYYSSSTNGHKYMNIRMGNNVYGIDQFYDVFYRPDIVTAKLKGENIRGLITLTIEDAIRNPPPAVDFTSVPSDSTTPKVEVCYQAKNTGGGIGEVRLFHNGKLIQSDGFYKDVAKTTAGKIQLASLDSKSIREDMRSIAIKSRIDISPIASKAKGDIFKGCVVVDAVPGENEISVSAFNKDNTVQSYMKTSSFKADIKAEDSHLYMLIVGTNQYNDQSINLQYAVKDANDIKDTLLHQSASLYKPENIHSYLLTDKEATKANIQSNISMLAKIIKPADSFILFVAGHGALLQNQYFMLTHDFDGAISDNSMLSSNEIVEASKQIRSLSQLFIFDTCHAGGVDYIVSGLYDARMSVLAKKMGLHIYASANDKQAALDGYKGNGLFTYTLLTGLNNKKEADKNNDGAVSLVELGGYSKQATADISKEIGHSQTPLIINFGRDNPIYKLQ